MRLLFLLSLVAFAAALINNENPLEKAKKFQAKLNLFARQNARSSIVDMLINGFQFQDCRGKILNSNQFADAVLNTPVNGVVTSARADKNHVIYKVMYSRETKEFMMTKKLTGWYLERGQDLIC
uniref:DUF3828 domain-containing protein n=1 Tax=Caenorhabditis tropicalis TaxID=1561998 RepID=A0A1I7UJD9_9PELO